MKNIVIYLALFLISFQSFSQVNNTFKKKKSVKIQKITKLNKDKVSDGTIDEDLLALYDWSWSGPKADAQVFTVNNNKYLFVLNRTGLVIIRQIKSDGTIGREIKKYNWTEGWTTSEFYTINNKTYLFLLKYSTGTVHIHLMNSDGTVGDMVLDKKWSKGWTEVELYTSNNQTYLFLLKHSGLVRIHKINSDGSVGNLVKEYNWSEGWTTSKFYTINNQTYLFLYKGGYKKYIYFAGLVTTSTENDLGPVKIHKINENGTVGNLIMERNWTKKWNCNFYSTNNKMYLYMNKQSGITRIHKIGERGIVGELVKEDNYANPPIITKFYSVNNNTFALYIYVGGMAEIRNVK